MINFLIGIAVGILFTIVSGFIVTIKWEIYKKE